MKKILLLAVFALSMFCYSTSDAQVRVSLNIGRQPTWGPVGYNYVDYYYLPDIDVYYYVPDGYYVYYDRGRWVNAYRLPSRYDYYDLYRGYKVVINQPRPWLNHAYYRTHYVKYRGYYGQSVIRDCHDKRYAYERERYNNSRRDHNDRSNDHRNDTYTNSDRGNGDRNNHPAPNRRENGQSGNDQNRDRSDNSGNYDRNRDSQQSTTDNRPVQAQQVNNRDNGRAQTENRPQRAKAEQGSSTNRSRSGESTSGARPNRRQ
jgi:hypothetical protein